MSDHDWKDDVAAYVVGALPADEADRVAREIAASPEAEAYARWLRPASDTLLDSTDPVTPPAALRGRLLDEVESDAAAEQVINGSRARAAAPTWRERLSAAMGVLSTRPAIAAVVVALLVAGIAGYVVGHSAGAGQPRTVEFAADTTLSTAQVHLMREGDRATVDVDRMPALASGRVYQVWLMKGDKATPSQIFVLRRDGSAVVPLPEDVSGYDGVQITREPAGGSKQPTGRPLARADLS